MADDPSQQRDDKDELREGALRSLVANVVGLAVQLGIIVAIAKRDSIWRLWRRYQWHVTREWRGAVERRLLAELQRDISAIEHGQGVD